MKTIAILFSALTALSATAAVPVGKYKCGATPATTARMEISAVNIGGKSLPFATFKHGSFKAEGMGTLITEGGATVVVLPAGSSSIKFGVYQLGILLEILAAGGDYSQKCTRL